MTDALTAFKSMLRDPAHASITGKTNPVLAGIDIAHAQRLFDKTVAPKMSSQSCRPHRRHAQDMANLAPNFVGHKLKIGILDLAAPGWGGMYDNRFAASGWPGFRIVARKPMDQLR